MSTDRVFPDDPPPSAASEEIEKAWWKEAVIYQIYPSSFCDSNGDGIGDLNGIHARLDYMKEMGVDVVWLSPIYKSPQKDMGYDISDYCDIDPRYGTLEDWDRMVECLHSLGMKIMMDLVVNHTSDEHAWFKDSRSSKASPKRDWYIWRPPKYDEEGNRMPPNNWKAVFQGSAWNWDETTQEYYLHLYLPGQPDLNWENPEVREAVWDVMRFWLERGTDGFRMDVINIISKVQGLPDAPIVNPREKYQPAPMYFANGPRVHEYLKEMHNKVLSKYNPITVGEAPFTHDMGLLAKYVLPAEKELNMIFQFEVMDIDSGGPAHDIPLMPRKWTLTELKEIVNRWQAFMREEGFWNSVFLENHDHSRSVSRFGNDSPKWRALSAKLLCLFQISQSGTLYLYQGEEIAMANAPRSWGIEQYKDIATQNYYNRILEERRADGKGDDMSDVMDGIWKKARDHGRLPIQWNTDENAGFTTGTPWMRVNDDYKEGWNVWQQMKDEDSVLNFWTSALEIRKANPVLIYGKFEPYRLRKKSEKDEDRVYAFRRTMGENVALVVLNFSSVPMEVDIGEFSFELNSRLVVSNYPDAPPLLPSTRIRLRGYEGQIYMQWRTIHITAPYIPGMGKEHLPEGWDKGPLPENLREFFPEA